MSDLYTPPDPIEPPEPDGGSVNTLFAQATTSVAFALTLSKHQCNVLLRVSEAGEPKDVPTHRYKTDANGPHLHLDVAHIQVPQMRALETKGLVWWARNAQGNASGFRGLTEAGKLVVGLLREAGMTVDNTNTVSTLRRLERRAA